MHEKIKTNVQLTSVYLIHDRTNILYIINYNTNFTQYLTLTPQNCFAYNESKHTFFWSLKTFFCRIVCSNICFTNPITFNLTYVSLYSYKMFQIKQIIIYIFLYSKYRKCFSGSMTWRLLMQLQSHAVDAAIYPKKPQITQNLFCLSKL